MSIRGLIILCVYGISGAIFGAIVSWILSIDVLFILGAAIIAGVGGMIITVEKSTDEKLADDLAQMEALSDSRK